MSIQTQIDRIKQAKADLISQIEAKGVTVPNDASLDDLAALVEAISTGVELPTLDNPASEAEVFGGYEYIDGAGSKKSGTFTVEEEVNNLKSLASELLTALDGKASAGVETYRVTLRNQGGAIPDLLWMTYTALEGGNLVTKQVENILEWDDSFGTEAATLENVVVGTSVVFAGSYQDVSFDGENIEVWFGSQGMADFGYIVYNAKILGDTTVTLTFE